MATIIRVRRGINGYRYSACDKDGFFIGNLEKLGDARKRWLKEIQWGQVQLIRELDKQPDVSWIDRSLTALDSMLRSYGRKRGKR